MIIIIVKIVIAALLLLGFVAFIVMLSILAEISGVSRDQ